MARKAKWDCQNDGTGAAQVVAAYAASHAGFRVFSATSIAACLMLATTAQAASINTEASSPQRPQTARTTQSDSRDARAIQNKAPATSTNDGVPDQNWSGQMRNAPPSRPNLGNVQQQVGRSLPPARAIASQVIPARSQPIAVRQVKVPVLGREGPAALAVSAANPARQTPPVSGRSIAITASEPVLDSIVRPQDVAAFQKIGAPYQVGGTWYVPAHEPDYDETGVASWYGADFQGRPTANGEIFDMNVVTAAHPTLPIPSLVEVTNLSNGRSIVVRVNDRGPFVGSRLIDLSARGAELLGYQREGHTNVRVRYVGPADVEPKVTAQNLTPARQLAATTSVKPLPQSQVPQPVFAQAEPAERTQSDQIFVQVGAYSQRANADRVRDQASGLGPVQVVEANQIAGTPLYRVVLGPVSSRAEATEKAMEMSNNGFVGARVLASLN